MQAQPISTLQAFLEDVVPTAYQTALSLTGDSDTAQTLLCESIEAARLRPATTPAGAGRKAWFLGILAERYHARGPAAMAGDSDVRHRVRDAERRDGYLRMARRLLNSVESEEVARALQGLPPRHREAATLYYVNELAHGEIGTCLGMPVEEVRALLHDARLLIQDALWRVAESRTGPAASPPARTTA